MSDVPNPDLPEDPDPTGPDTGEIPQQDVDIEAEAAHAGAQGQQPNP